MFTLHLPFCLVPPPLHSFNPFSKFFPPLSSSLLHLILNKQNLPVHTYTIDSYEFTANICVFDRFRLDIPCDLVFPLSRHSNLKLTEQNVVSLSNNGCAGKYARVCVYACMYVVCVYVCVWGGVCGYMDIYVSMSVRISEKFLLHMCATYTTLSSFLNPFFSIPQFFQLFNFLRLIHSHTHTHTHSPLTHAHTHSPPPPSLQAS